MGKSDQPQQPKDLIVMTRLNTVGLKRLAEGTLVEKRPFESRPPEPMRVAAISEPSIVPPPSRAAAVPTLLEEDELGADAGEDRTVALGADGADDRTVAAPIRPPAPPQTPPLARAEAPASVPPPSKGKLDIETPTALFVKDIQRTLQEELNKYEPARVAVERKVTPAAAASAKLGFAETVIDARPETKSVDAKVAETKKSSDRPMVRTEPALNKSASVPPPPATKSAALTAPQKSSGSLPAPLPAQASRRKDPVAVSVSTRPRRVERKGGFVPWAAALTALGVFVGVAGARVATGAPFLHAAGAPQAAPAAAPQAAPVEAAGFAPKVAVPAAPKAEEAPAVAAQADSKPAPAPAEVKVAEETKPAEAKPVEAKAAEPKPEPKVAEAKPEKVEKPAAEAKPEPRVERPRPHRPAPPPSEEKVAKADPKPEKAEKPEPAPKPAKADKPEPKKSSEVGAAARDYANVDSTLGSSL